MSIRKTLDNISEISTQRRDYNRDITYSIIRQMRRMHSTLLKQDLGQSLQTELIYQLTTQNPL